MITIKHKGDFSKFNTFSEKLLNLIGSGKLDRYGRLGIDALADATPKDTGLAASSWDYVITRNDGSVSITWINNDIEGGYNIAILVQYGHATKSGTYVEGVDYINPAMRVVFEQIANDLWKEVN